MGMKSGGPASNVGPHFLKKLSGDCAKNDNGGFSETMLSAMVHELFDYSISIYID